MTLPDKPSESDTTRSGAFSYASEFHAFAIGMAVGAASLAPSRVKAYIFGVVGVPPNSTRKGVAQEVQKEPWYLAGGYVIGLMLGVLVYGAAASSGLAVI